MSTTDDARQYAPATQRNREPILEILRRVLPEQGTILEVGSGTGEHAVFFAPRLKPRQWLPSDPNPQRRASITAWSACESVDNLYPPLDIDVQTSVWSVEKETLVDWETSPLNAIVSINLIHIAPWSACLGLIAGASRLLPPGGILYLYGPFKRNGQHTAASNAAFDASLQASNPDWGVRDLEDVVAIAQDHHLVLPQIYPMPANNLSVVFHHS